MFYFVLVFWVWASVGWLVLGCYTILPTILQILVESSRHIFIFWRFWNKLTPHVLSEWMVEVCGSYLYRYQVWWLTLGVTIIILLYIYYTIILFLLLLLYLIIYYTIISYTYIIILYTILFSPYVLSSFFWSILLFLYSSQSPSSIFSSPLPFLLPIFLILSSFSPSDIQCSVYIK